MGDPAAGQPGGVYSVMQDPRLVGLLVVLVASIVTAATSDTSSPHRARDSDGCARQSRF